MPDTQPHPEPPENPAVALFAKVAFFASIFLLGAALGYVIHRRAWWPIRHIERAEEAFRGLQSRADVRREWYYVDTDASARARIHDAAAMQPGPTLVAFLGADRHQFIQVIDRDANPIQEWRVDWFDLWPNADHLTEDLRPKELPGAIVHGVLLLDDGSVLLQHDACGLVKLDACGHVVWRVPARTHHSLHIDERGHIWTSIRHTREEPPEGLAAYRAPYEEYTVVEISPDGKILQEVSLFDLLRENNLTGYLMMASFSDNDPAVGGDTLHVNDVEVFPQHLEPGVFRPGDVMVSMRRPGTIVVFDLPKRAVRYVSTGGFVRQHDPDFVDGNTISVFDNHNVGSRADGAQSRIVVEDARTGEDTIAFAGTREQPFFTDIMGKHQWLPNGNLLLVESTTGRVLEVTPDGRIAWEFINVIGDKLAGAVSEGTRLPEKFSADFFASRRAACERPLSERVAHVPSE